MFTYTQPEIEMIGELSGNVRIGHRIGTKLRRNRPPSLVIVGFPSDSGITRIGDRPGARKAPDAIRRQFYHFMPNPEYEEEYTRFVSRIADLGNLERRGCLEESQTSLAETVTGYLKREIPVVVIGGGHGTAFGHFLGYVHAGLAVDIINWDAHADLMQFVDGRAHSGSVFRQAVEHPSRKLKNYTVAGLLRHTLSADQLTYMKENGIGYYFRDDISKVTIQKIYAGIRERTMVSFDLDVVDSAFAPGVGSPATGGLYPVSLFAAARLAGQSRNVASVDICEVDPSNDIDERTARLAALLIWHYIDGCIRKKMKSESQTN